MKCDIDMEKLEIAVNKAVAYHPVFKMKLKKEKRLYYLVPDDSPIKIAISDWKENITYGTRWKPYDLYMYTLFMRWNGCNLISQNRYDHLSHE